ncbi:hypothetical protein POTOM_029101 [Populus tomentosa]|uniref:Tyrosine specific protein phosphatases domain-containing protein n=1 Tax=Populus tomentosa TaxID=118781 RepID=A0A8X7ZC67_POPTO|nr:hypothetical protein POTOM_029101 [Populus tomentosa]
MDVGLSILMVLQATALFLIFVSLQNLDFTLLSLPFLFTSGEEPYNEICEGVYVGGWPYSVDKLPPGNPAIIDCTCEFPRKEEFKGHSYLCLPTWDTRAPQPGEIESAVEWASRKRAQNVPVFIHCAYGRQFFHVIVILYLQLVLSWYSSKPRLAVWFSEEELFARLWLYEYMHVLCSHGRSVAVMCALLVALGVVEDWKKAELFIRERRPYISMNSVQYKALEEWSKHRLSTPSIDEVNSSSAVSSTSSGRPRADRPKNRSG